MKWTLRGSSKHNSYIGAARLAPSDDSISPHIKQQTGVAQIIIHILVSPTYLVKRSGDFKPQPTNYTPLHRESTSSWQLRTYTKCLSLTYVLNFNSLKHFSQCTLLHIHKTRTICPPPTNRLGTNEAPPASSHPGGERRVSGHNRGLDSAINRETTVHP